MKRAKDSLTDSTTSPSKGLQEPATNYGTIPSMLDRIRMGVPRKAITAVQHSFGLSQMDMAKVLDISARTLQRYDDEQIMDAPTSEKILLLERVYKMGQELFPSDEDFAKWLHIEIRSLNFQSPASLLDTYTGIKEVRQVLGRIKHGMF